MSPYLAVIAVFIHVHHHNDGKWKQSETRLDIMLSIYSRCNITTNPIIPNMAVFIHGCSESMIVT